MTLVPLHDPLRLASYTPIAAADVIVFREGDYAIAVDGKTKQVIAKSTDHAEVLQKAVDALTNGGEVFIKGGVYEISTPIKVTKSPPITLRGERGFAERVAGKGEPGGPWGTVLKATSPISEVILISDNTNYVRSPSIKSLTIDGYGNANYGIHVNYAGGVVIQDVEIYNCIYDGIFLEGAAGAPVSTVMIDRVSSVWNDRNGLRATTNVEFLTTYHLLTIGNGEEGIYSSARHQHHFFPHSMSDARLMATPKIAMRFAGLYHDMSLYSPLVEGGGKVDRGIQIILPSNAHVNVNVYSPTILDLASGGYAFYYHPYDARHSLKIRGGKAICDNFIYVNTSYAGFLLIDGVNLEGVSSIGTISGVIYKIVNCHGYITANSGTATFSGDGSTTQFKVAHGLVKAPKTVVVTPASPDAAGDFYVTWDDTYIYVNYKTAPPSGTDNVKLSWYAEV